MSCTQYANAHGCIGTAVSTHGGGSLPVTGFDLLALLYLGAVLLVVGLIVHEAQRSRS